MSRSARNWHGVATCRRRAHARKRLPLFGLEGFADVYPTALSGGMRQRAALLRTVLMERDVLLLDEPFGALDALTRAALQEWLLGAWAAEGQTVAVYHTRCGRGGVPRRLRRRDDTPPRPCPHGDRCAPPPPTHARRSRRRSNIQRAKGGRAGDIGEKPHPPASSPLPEQRRGGEIRSVSGVGRMSRHSHPITSPLLSIADKQWRGARGEVFPTPRDAAPMPRNSGPRRYRGHWAG